MATRSSLSLEMWPLYTRSPPLRTLRYVVRERPLLGREKRRSGRYAVKLLRSSGMSTDSTETEVEPAESITETSPTESPEASQKADASASLKGATTEETAAGSSIETTGYMARPPRKPLSELNVGDVMEGVVKNVVKYGVFLDARCVLDVFVHVSDISYTFVEDAREVLRRGMKVKLKLLEAEHKLKASLKDLNTFDIKPPKEKSEQREKKESKKYPMAEEFEGVVEKVLARGAFVKFDNGHTSGFLPAEEISTGKDLNASDIRADELVVPQQLLTVRVIETDKRSGKHTLSMRAYEEIEYERKGKREGFFIDADDSDDSGDAAILSAAFKKAGIVREMFIDVESEMEMAAMKEVETVETIAPTSVGPMPTSESEIVSPFNSVKSKAAEPDAEVQSFHVEVSDSETAVEEEQEVVEDVTDLKPEMEKEDTDVASETESKETLLAESTAKEMDTVKDGMKEGDTEVEEQQLEVIAADPVAEVQSSDTQISEVIREEEQQQEPSQAIDAEKEESEEPIASVAAVPSEKPAVDASSASVEEVASKAPVVAVSASLVKELRDMTGAGMMDCKKALTECNGDMDAAIEYLKRKGIASAAKRSSKVASEGAIASYIHTGNRLGVLLEVNSETDFVARTEDFRTFVKNVAMTIAANPDAICVRPEDFPKEILEKEKEMEMSKDDLQDKPDAIKEKIVSGRLEKVIKTAAVLKQPFIQNQEITVQDALNDVTSSLGEKIVIRRFVRYELGEGLEKKSKDFAAEVAEQIASKKAEAASQPDPVEEETSAEEKPTITIPAAMVKELRQMTGGGLMDCKRALIESEGDMDKAVEYLRMKGLAGAAKKASRLASEGVVRSYIHRGSRLGIMAEVNCETDFVARGDDFRKLADDIAMHLAACPEVVYVSSEDVPEAVLDKEMEIEMQVEDLQSKPENIRAKIAEGRVQKTMTSMCLFDQPFLRDPEKTIGDIVKEHIAALGENIKVRRFVRFNLGEGIEKAESDFAEEVGQIQKQ